METERNAYTEGRLRLAVINKDNILECLAGKIKITGLPDDCKMYEVYYNNRTMCFELLISSMEFEQIVEGAELEKINSICEVRNNENKWSCENPDPKQDLIDLYNELKEKN